MELFDGFCCLPLFDVMFKHEMWDHLGILISYDFFMSRKKQFNKQDLGETVRHLRHAPTDLPSSVNADMDLRFASLHATLVIFATMLCSSFPHVIRFFSTVTIDDTCMMFIYCIFVSSLWSLIMAMDIPACNNVVPSCSH